MPVIIDEQSEKKESLFLKYEPENTLALKSHLYKMFFHYLKKAEKSVACKDRECVFCSSGVNKRTEYNYFVNLNGQDGVLNVKPSVFFAMQAIAKASKKDIKQISWLVIRTGQGLETEYTVSKNDNLTEDEWEKVREEVEEYTERLSKIIESKEAALARTYEEYRGEFQNVISDEEMDEIDKAISEPKEENLPV